MRTQLKCSSSRHLSRALLLPLALCAGCHTRQPTDFGLLRVPARIALAHKDGFMLRALDPQGATPLACRVHRIEADLTRTAPDTLWLSNVLVHGRAARRQPCSAGPAFVVLAESPELTPGVVTVSRGRTVLAVLGGLTTIAGAAVARRLHCIGHRGRVSCRCAAVTAEVAVYSVALTS